MDKLLQDLIAKIQDLQKALVDVQAILTEEEKAAYDKGYALGKLDGIASVVIPVVDPDLKFKQADLDKAVLEAVLALKVILSQKYAEFLVVEKQAETGFAELLK